MAYAIGDEVVATCDIGDANDHIPKGCHGVVTEAGVFVETKVVFTVASFSGDRKVELWVNNDDITTPDTPERDG